MSGANPNANSSQHAQDQTGIIDHVYSVPPNRSMESIQKKSKDKFKADAKSLIREPVAETKSDEIPDPTDGDLDKTGPPDHS